MDIYYVDGEFVRAEDARVPAGDLVVLRGFGVFDFMITYNRRPFHLEDHVDRLGNSAREIGLKINKSHEEICGIVRETLEKNAHHEESFVRLLHTGGVSDDGVTPRDNGIFMVMVTPRRTMEAGFYEKGASIITVDMARFKPTAKSTNYLSAVFALQEARKSGAVEAVYVDRDHQVSEGTTSNIFGVKSDTLVTPDKGLLPGITRKVVLDLIKDEFELELRQVALPELMEMDEVFLASSNKEVMPVVKVDDQTIGTGLPGKVTKKVMALFREYTKAYGEGKV
ncbi:aminotransferase class IV [Desulfospira joergensenii]|uniref:aminotransferase class IV n=1 Tax=Desulfospira joergensenii TaxID=53329 RepID=UPI0003B68AF9|nr:aminotransferase class IV [Desulfospira joergensenii]